MRLKYWFCIASVVVLATQFDQGQEIGLKVHNLATPGAVVIDNNGEEVSLSSKVTVERKRDGQWITANVVFELTEWCGAGQTPADCVTIPSGGSMKLVPWNGYTCSGQCPRSCRSNHYAGPGEFRFVVFTCDGKQRQAGAAFTMPPENRR